MEKVVQVKWDKVISLSEPALRPICRWIDLGNGTMFRMGAFFTSPAYDMSRLGLFVGIEQVGSFLFSLDHPIGYRYVSEKLYVPESDARALADWINTQIGHIVPQQGIYSREYIEQIEPIIYGQEIPLMPLAPIITGDI